MLLGAHQAISVGFIAQDDFDFGVELLASMASIIDCKLVPPPEIRTPIETASPYIPIRAASRRARLADLADDETLARPSI